MDCRLICTVRKGLLVQELTAFTTQILPLVKLIVRIR